MQVTLGRRGDYAVRAMVDLARHHGEGRRKAREIAEAMDIPQRYLTQILAELVRRGLLAAVAGPDGGYSFTRTPGDVSLLEVVEAAEGPIAIDRCVLRGGPCDWERICPLHPAWSRAQGALVRELAATSFAELAAADAALAAGYFDSPAAGHSEPTERRGRR